MLGEDHPDTATSLNNLATNLQKEGRHKEAEEGFQKALAIRRKVLGEEHRDTARSYQNVGTNLQARGNYKEAEAWLSRSAEAFLAMRLQLAHPGLERAARIGEESPLPTLAALLARNGKLPEAWQRLEQGLGRGMWDELSIRLRQNPADQAHHTELIGLLERLDRLIRAALPVKAPTPEQERVRADLLEQRQRVQAELTAFTRQMERNSAPGGGRVFDRAQIQAVMPEDTALLAWVDLPPVGPKTAEPNGEHWAVLLRSSGFPRWERLQGSGTDGAWIDADTDLPFRLRTALLERRGGWQQLAKRLAQQRLGPISKHLGARDGLPAVKHLVVLPSAALAGLPIELLVDGYTVSYGFSGTLYAHLRRLPKANTQGLLALGDPIFETVKGAAKEKPLPPGGVLLTLVQPGSNAAQGRLRPDDVLLKYGDHDLGTAKDLQKAIAAADGKTDVTVQVWRDGKVSSRRVHPGKLGVVLATEPAPKALAERYRLDRRLNSRSGDDGWRPLPGTRVEVESLRRLFGAEPKPLVLLDAEASQKKLYELAQSRELKKYRYLHLATHGVIDEALPLRSALILSRDALPDPTQQLLAGLPVYDGYLTAQEVLRQWSLDSELVTLSACETALGKYERGEGFVGFAQALVLAGSRTTCLSLWKNDDAATALLMERFYANLLGKRKGLAKPMAKAVALAEAKQWLRTLSREEALQRAAAVSSGVERGKGRPKVPLPPPPLPESDDPESRDHPYAHPYYWAAFILIGDPG
jgi:tetratricopeptide (TPR) repeat protein